MDFRFHRLSSKDYLGAKRWYARQSARVAARFAIAVNEALEAILADPYAWPKHDDQFRWFRVRKFPYVLYFEILHDGTIHVIAVSHTSRRPGYWKRRVRLP